MQPILMSVSIFSNLIDSMSKVSLADILIMVIHEQEGFIVGCGGHGHDRVEQQIVQHPQQGKLFSEYL